MKTADTFAAYVDRNPVNHRSRFLCKRDGEFVVLKIVAIECSDNFDTHFCYWFEVEETGQQLTDVPAGVVRDARISQKMIDLYDMSKTEFLRYST